MRKILRSFRDSFKRSVFYLVWGTTCLIGSIISELAGLDGIILFYLGTIIVLFGIVFWIIKIFTKENCEKLDDNELEERISEIGSKRKQNVLRNIYTYLKRYRSKDKFLCRFVRKNGTVLIIFEESKEKAKSYIDWYLNNECENKIMNINISESRVTKIIQDDIEELEYKKVSYFQRILINPMRAFLRQQNLSHISLGSIFKLSLLIIIGVGSYYYFNNNYSFIGDGSLLTLSKIYSSATAIIKTILMLLIITTIILNIISIKKALNDFYFNTIKPKKTVGSQLITLLTLLFTFEIFLQGIVKTFIRFAQSYGYFMQ
ncbi:MAG: hypothetical protein N4A68_05525 [Maledivibacter sp.]|jgi:hypothetical protein|nr:hypothetical protein [Maledivibacter sp.]